MDTLVFDTSAILNVGQRGKLQPLLARLATLNRLFTTSDVVAELTDPAHKDFNAALLRDYFTVQRATAVPFDLGTISRLTLALDPGEISVILFAAEVKGIAVLDERAARREAKILALRFTGTIGLLHQGLQKKWLTEPECLARVVKLCDAGFAISRPAAGQSFADYFAALE